MHPEKFFPKEFESGRAGGWTETFSISGPTNQEIEDHIDSHLARLIQTSEED